MSQHFKGDKQQFSSKFRETLFNQRGNQNENVLFNQTQGIIEQQRKIPRPMDAMYDETGGISNERNKQDEKTQSLIERMFKVVDKKLTLPEFGGIMEDALKSSIFGVFGKTFKHFQQTNQKFAEKEKSYLNYFNGSDILSDD